MSRLSSGIGAGKEEARQLLRRASSRFNGLLSGYRSLCVQSDDLDRHEYSAPLIDLASHVWAVVLNHLSFHCHEHSAPLSDHSPGLEQHMQWTGD